MNLSICIISWNVKDLLKKCLDSIYKNPPFGGFEVIVADNNSGDGSAGMIGTSFPQVILIENKKNLGFSAANNRCIKQSIGKYILVLNPDTEILPGSLNTLTNFLDEHPDAGAVAPKLLNPDKSLQRSVLGFPTLGAMIMRLLFIEQLWPGNSYTRRYLLPDLDYDKEAGIDQPMGAAVMIRKEVLDNVGLFDEKSFMFFDEVDLCFRIKKAGWKIYFTPSAKVIHQGGSSIKKWGPLNLGRHWTRSRDIFFKKHYGILSVLILHLFDLLRAVIILTVAGLIVYIALRFIRLYCCG